MLTLKELEHKSNEELFEIEENLRKRLNSILAASPDGKNEEYVGVEEVYDQLLDLMVEKGLIEKPEKLSPEELTKKARKKRVAEGFMYLAIALFFGLLWFNVRIVPQYFDVEPSEKLANWFMAGVILFASRSLYGFVKPLKTE